MLVEGPQHQDRFTHDLILGQTMLPKNALPHPQGETSTVVE